MIVKAEDVKPNFDRSDCTVPTPEQSMKIMFATLMGICDDDARNVLRHHHKCDGCGTFWKHSPFECALEELDHPDDEDFSSHSCPTCGKKQLASYEGQLRPDLMDER